MDAFEQFRDVAAKLHDRLVTAGADPNQPIDMVGAAIRDLELELAFLAPGDPALKGARALFDEQSGTICCEEAGRTERRAGLADRS